MLSLLVLFALNARAQTARPTPTPAPTPAARPTPTPCPTPETVGTTPSATSQKGPEPPTVIRVGATWQKGDKAFPLARKSLYLSPRPFNLEKLPNLGPAPSRRSYYTAVKASTQLINWLELNNCDTVYCREIRPEEVTCKPGEGTCVPEFVAAYGEALSKLNNNAELARKWLTNYGPFSQPELRTGFYHARTKYIEAAIAAIQQSNNFAPGIIRSAVTDRTGYAYFYDVCPGSYYISNIAPIEVENDRLLWETGAIKVEQPAVLETVPVSLISAPLKKPKKNSFVSKKATASLERTETNSGN